MEITDFRAFLTSADDLGERYMTPFLKRLEEE